MAKFTREQLNKWNSQAGNGFKIDVQKLLFWGDKELEYIGEERADHTHFEITLSFIDEKEGEGWSAKRTGKQLLKLDVKRMIPASGNKPDDEVKMYEVDFSVYSEIIGEPQNKKMYSYMAKMSHTIDVLAILEKAEAARPIEEKPEAAPVILGESATQAEEPAQEIKDSDSVYEGASFETASGEVITITRLTDMSVDFSNSSNLYDFGTSRTVGAIINALESSNGKGVKCFYNPAPETEEPTQEEPTAKAETIEAQQEEAEAAPEEDTAEAESEPAQKAAPDMVTALKNDGIDPESAFDVAVMSGGWDALKPETSPETSPETDTAEEEPAEAETTPETSENTPTEAAPAFDMFATLAQAYITGTQAPKQEKPQEDTPDPVKEPETLTQDIERAGKTYTVKAEKNNTSFVGGELYTVTISADGETLKSETTTDHSEARRLFWEFCETWTPAAGYTDTDNNRMEEAARLALSNGNQYETSGKYAADHKMLIPVNRSENVKYIYSSTMYEYETIQPRSLDYIGFLIGQNYYTDTKPIIDKYRYDVNKKLIELIPDEHSASNAAANVDEYERKRIDSAKEYPRDSSARNLFYNGKKPELWLFGKSKDYITTDEVINYLLNPAETIDRAALAYMCEAPAHIYIQWIEYNKTLTEYNAIVNDPTREEHELLKIRNSVTDEKTLRIELVNGKEVRAEARAVKAITRNGHIDSWYILAADRGLLSKDEYNRPADIQLKDIVAIKHGGRVLYKAA